jgi:hypothetical protein
MHVAPGIDRLQSLPHAEQSAEALVRSMHALVLPQTAWVVLKTPLQYVPHSPPLQNWSSLRMHTMPHPPQLALSVWGSTQIPSHASEPTEHDAEQTPWLQMGVAPEHAGTQPPPPSPDGDP